MFEKEFFIAGVQHHKMHKVLDRLELGDTLSLIPEPTNKYDPNAVRIECSDSQDTAMCGYVPKKFSSEVVAQISIGKLLKCEIVLLQPDKEPWEQCKVKIEEVPDAN